MSLQTIVMATLIAGIGAIQYILMTQAIRDLIRRPRVRGGNKVSWGLAILCLPIAGALIYAWMGPTSFIRRASPSNVETIERAGGPASPARPAPRVSPSRIAADRHRNVTPIRRPPRPEARPSGPPSHTRRTGS